MKKILLVLIIALLGVTAFSAMAAKPKVKTCTARTA